LSASEGDLRFDHFDASPCYFGKVYRSIDRPFVLSIIELKTETENSQTRRRFGGLHPLCGIGVVSLIEVTRMPAWLIARIADSRPPPGPFTRTSTSRIPASSALRAASPAACWAAKGVPFREPRKPLAPDDDCATRLPLASVIEIIVLLNEAAI
jgi:hypothetical protein